MTEPDNFEEDLFADLYTEDDTAVKPAAPEPEVTTEPIVQTELKAEAYPEHTEQNGEGDDQMYNGEQDMDDEIDFNLGNGNGAGNSYDVAAANESNGPGIKEDG